MAGATTSKEARMKVLWNTAARLGTFSAHHLTDETKYDIQLVRDAIRDWAQRGLVEESHIGPHKRKYFKLTMHATALPEATVLSEIAGGRKCARENLWRTMRALLTFTARDAAICSTTDDVAVSEEAAQDYCQMLTRSGHLVVLQRAQPGRRPAIYQLVRNTGPRPPKERRLTAVYDENLDEYPYIAGVTP